MPPLIDFDNFDALALLEKERENLKTTKAWNEVESFIATSEEKWQKQIEESQV